MSVERCENKNHSKMNVVVRNCTSCGEIVNQKISKRHCSNEDHARRRKDRNAYCANCGKDLLARS